MSHTLNAPAVCFVQMICKYIAGRDMYSSLTGTNYICYSPSLSFSYSPKPVRQHIGYAISQQSCVACSTNPSAVDWIISAQTRTNANNNHRSTQYNYCENINITFRHSSDATSWSSFRSSSATLHHRLRARVPKQHSRTRTTRRVVSRHERLSFGRAHS